MRMTENNQNKNRNEIIKTTYMNKSIQVEGKFCFFDDYENIYHIKNTENCVHKSVAGQTKAEYSANNKELTQKIVENNTKIKI